MEKGRLLCWHGLAHLSFTVSLRGLMVSAGLDGSQKIGFYIHLCLEVATPPGGALSVLISEIKGGTDSFLACFVV